jgi:hypothetical protein
VEEFVMLRNQVSKEQVMHAAEYVKKMYDPNNETDRNTMKNGFLLFRQGLVYNVRSDGSIVNGKVQNVTIFDVTLDLDFHEMSTCSCSAPNWCRHKLAVFFYVYSNFASVGDFMNEWKNRQIRIGGIIPHHIPVKKAASIHSFSLYKEDSFTSWLALFEQQYEQFSSNRTLDQMYAAALYRGYYSQLKKLAPKAPEKHRLFIIHAVIATVQRMIESTETLQLSDFAIDMFVRPHIEDLVNEIGQMAQTLRSTHLPFSLDPLLEDSIEHVAQLLFCGRLLQYSRFYIYQILWSTLYNRKKWIEQERERLLERMESERQKADGFTIECQLALIHLDFLQKRDQEAINAFKQLKGNTIVFGMSWMSTLSRTKNWDRLKRWLPVLLEKLETHVTEPNSFDQKRYIVGNFLHILEDYAIETKRIEEYEHAAKRLLPYSYNEYSYFLLENHHFRQWTEVQILLGFDVDDFDRQLLKEIEEEDREALLPLYHHAVQKAIEEKNRQSYKRAVKYLKKLRTSYRRLKREHFWEHYMEYLQHSTKRLRAFHEELKRGKLIHDPA